MNHTNKIAIAVFVAFFIYVTLRGELSDYIEILRGVKDEEPKAGASASDSKGNILFGSGSILEKFGVSVGESVQVPPVLGSDSDSKVIEGEYLKLPDYAPSKAPKSLNDLIESYKKSGGIFKTPALEGLN